MNFKNVLLSSTMLFLGFNAICQNQFAKQQLKEALSNKGIHNVIDNTKLILKDSTTAITIAETVLFDIYGKDNIIRQKPYSSILIDNHWIISGVLPERYKGGTFLIIIDARNCKIIRITHGK